jgi:tripartite-type tricarboxylate transporter receptor subunit TctC
VLVGMVSMNPTCIIVNPGVPANSLKELVSLVKANPGKYAYGAAGVPDMRVQVFNGVFAPAGMPPERMDILKNATAKVRAEPAFLQDLEKAGAEPFSAPGEEKFLAEEVARWTRVIKATGFKAQ